MSLQVLSPGTYSLLVDGGRPRTRGLGIAVGGPADRAALMLGNALVGNSPLAAALELTLSGPTLLALDDTGLCVFGAPFQIERDGQTLRFNHTFTLKKGETLRIGGTSEGCRAYLCVVGGFRAQPVLDSVTQFEPLKADEVLECAESRLPGRSLDLSPPAPLAEAGRSATDVASSLLGTEAMGLDFSGRLGRNGLRCLLGPQADWFDDSFFKHAYLVTPASNRMGIRLDGPALALPSRELVSEPVAPGAVQITNDGKPIVLGVDGQTIGGYPKIAHVISADLDVLGQLRPGDEVRFASVGEKEAESIGTQQRESLQSWLKRVAAAVS